jgi:hypothetical protein
MSVKTQLRLFTLGPLQTEIPAGSGLGGMVAAAQAPCTGNYPAVDTVGRASPHE